MGNGAIHGAFYGCTDLCHRLEILPPGVRPDLSLRLDLL